MTLSDAVREIVERWGRPVTPQEIREEIKAHFPQFFDTESNRTNVERGHYRNLDDALLAQIYNRVRTGDAYLVDKTYKPYRVSFVERDLAEEAGLEDLENLEQPEGVVYVLSTDTFTRDGKEILKIGFTTQDVETRIAQLYTTGVPFKFRVVKTYQTQNYLELERALHKLLEPFRLDHAREFFTSDTLPYIDRVIELHGEILASAGAAE